MPIIKSIERKSARLLEKYGLDKKLPINVDLLATKYLDINVTYEDLEDNVSGVLLFKKNKGTASIGINSNHHPKRQRFSCAHEIAHYVLHRSEQHLFVDTKMKGADLAIYRKDGFNKATYKVEVEANSFAAALLMPASLIEKELTRLDEVLDFYGTDSSTIRKLAELFNVSEQAMAIRISELSSANY